MSTAYPVKRALALLVILAGVTGVLGLRVFGSPEIEAYRTAMASAPGGGLYAALSGRRFLEVSADGDVRSRWQSPPGTPLSLAASGDQVLFGTEAGLHLSVNRGRTWQRVIPRGRFLAVAIRGDLALAGAWADRLWLSRDAGLTWSAAGLTAKDTEVEAIGIGPGAAVVATLLGAMVSADGSSWERTSLPTRITALDSGPAGFLAGSWPGSLFASPDGRTWEPAGTVGEGVWALSGPRSIAGTTQGLYSAAGRLLAFSGREMTAVVASGDADFAAVARGPILGSVDGGQTWRVVIQR